MKILLVILLACLLAFTAQSQTDYKRKDYSSKPLWIKMMNDTTVNYYETVKAFRVYFKRRPLPKEPNEIEGTDRFEIEVGLEDEEEVTPLPQKSCGNERRRKNVRKI